LSLSSSRPRSKAFMDFVVSRSFQSRSTSVSVGGLICSFGTTPAASSFFRPVKIRDTVTGCLRLCRGVCDPEQHGDGECGSARQGRESFARHHHLLHLKPPRIPVRRARPAPRDRSAPRSLRTSPDRRETPFRCRSRRLIRARDCSTRAGNSGRARRRALSRRRGPAPR